MCIFAGMGLGPGDEVITVSHTFNATVSSILFTGAMPVFVDIEPDTYLIDAGRIEAAITPRTRAIFPVHLFGLVADMDPIGAIADRYGLPDRRGRVPGPRRALPRTPRRELRPRRVQPLRHEEHDDGRGRPHHDRRRPSRGLAPALPEPGHEAALPPRDPRVQLPDDGHPGRDRARPARQARAEHGAPAGARGPLRRGASPACRSPSRRSPRAGRTSTTSTRSTVARPSATRSSPTWARPASASGIYYPIPVHRQQYVLERGIEADLPVTDAAAATCISLPMFPGLTNDEQDQVVDALRGAVARRTRTPGAGRAAR